MVFHGYSSWCTLAQHAAVVIRAEPVVALSSALPARADGLQPPRPLTVFSIGRVEAGTSIAPFYILLVPEGTEHPTDRSSRAPISGSGGGGGGTAAEFASVGVPCEPVRTEHATLEPWTEFPLR